MPLILTARTDLQVEVALDALFTQLWQQRPASSPAQHHLLAGVSGPSDNTLYYWRARPTTAGRGPVVDAHGKFLVNMANDPPTKPWS